MLSRRTMLLAPLGTLAAPVARAIAASAKMTLAIHQNTSAAAGYRKSLEGWARAGVKNVEITAPLLDDFLKTDSLAAAKSVLTDNGLTPVSCACGVNGLWEPNPNHAAAIESLKKRCEQLAVLGLQRFYAPVTPTTMFTEDDIYKTGASSPRRDMPARCRWSCSCRSSSRAIRTRWLAKSGRRPKRSCARRGSSDRRWRMSASLSLMGPTIRGSPSTATSAITIGSSRRASSSPRAVWSSSG